MSAEFDQDALTAAIDLVGRSGATGCEVGYLHDNVPAEQAGWYAHAQFRGARLTSEDHVGPAEAAEGLARRVLRGAQCTHCQKTVSLNGFSKNKCRWTREGARWVRGCAK